MAQNRCLVELRGRKDEGKEVRGGRLEITRNGGKPLFVGVIRVRGGGQKTQPLSGIATELRGCLEAGGGRCGKMEGKMGRWRKTAIYGTFKGTGKRKKKGKK